MSYCFILLLFTTMQATLLRDLDTTIIINDIVAVADCSSSVFSIKLSVSTFLNENALTGTDGYLISSSGSISQLTACSKNVDDDAVYYIQCSVDLPTTEQYSFKNFTSDGYKYISNIPSTSIIQKSVTYQQLNYDDFPNQVIQGQSFQLPVSENGKVPNLFFDISNNFIEISCSSGDDDVHIKCTAPSSFDLTQNIVSNLFERDPCGKIKPVSSVGPIKIDSFTFSGEKYINIDIIQDNLYTIYLGTITSEIGDIAIKDSSNSKNVLSLSNCTLMGVKYYQCLILIPTPLGEVTERKYSVYKGDTMLVEEAIVLFKPVTIPSPRIIPGTLSLTGKNSITFQFTEVVDTSVIKDIKMISNSLTTQNTCTKTDGSNSVSYECSFTTTENCTVSYYYLNSTNGLNKLGDDLIIGSGNPYYDSSMFINRYYIILSIVIIVLMM